MIFVNLITTYLVVTTRDSNIFSEFASHACVRAIRVREDPRLCDQLAAKDADMEKSCSHVTSLYQVLNFTTTLVVTSGKKQHFFACVCVASVYIRATRVPGPRDQLNA